MFVFDDKDDEFVVTKAFASYPLTLKVNTFVTMPDKIIKATEKEIVTFN